MSHAVVTKSSEAFPNIVPISLTDVVSLVGRVFIAALFLLSGLGKLSAPTATMDMIADAGLPFPPLACAAAVLVEVVGSLALIFGYQTRVVAVVLALFTAATAATFHTNFVDQNQFIHFFKNVTIVGGLLQVVAFGAGRRSLDGHQ